MFSLKMCQKWGGRKNGGKKEQNHLKFATLSTKIQYLWEELIFFLLLFWLLLAFCPAKNQRPFPTPSVTNGIELNSSVMARKQVPCTISRFNVGIQERIALVVWPSQVKQSMSIVKEMEPLATAQESSMCSLYLEISIGQPPKTVPTLLQIRFLTCLTGRCIWVWITRGFLAGWTFRHSWFGATAPPACSPSTACFLASSKCIRTSNRLAAFNAKFLRKIGHSIWQFRQKLCKKSIHQKKIFFYLIVKIFHQQYPQKNVSKMRAIWRWLKFEGFLQ